MPEIRSAATTRPARRSAAGLRRPRAVGPDLRRRGRHRRRCAREPRAAGDDPEQFGSTSWSRPSRDASGSDGPAPGRARSWRSSDAGPTPSAEEIRRLRGEPASGRRSRRPTDRRIPLVRRNSRRDRLRRRGSVEDRRRAGRRPSSSLGDLRGRNPRMADPSPMLLWTPSADRIERAAITAFARTQGLSGDYDELWRWSVDDIERFWASVWDYFEVDGELRAGARTRVEMPGAEWFPGDRASTTPSTSSAAKTTPRSRSATPPSCASSAELTLGRAARADRPDPRRPDRAGGRAAATASSPTCRTSRRRSPPSSPAPRSARSGRRLRPTSAPAA